MKPAHRISLAVAICLLALPAPRAARAATYDLTGTWSYTTSGNWVTGVCPKGKDSSGTLQITQTGDSFTLKLLSGMVCNPASLCSYSGGTIAGAVYTATNTAVVDTEGGKATNAITFTATSTSAATGSDSSSYVHPQGMTCTWGFNISLSRSTPDGGPAKDSGGVLPDAAPDKGSATPDSGSAADASPPRKTDDGSGCQLGGGAPADLTLLALLVLPLWLRHRRGGLLPTAEAAPSPAAYRAPPRRRVPRSITARPC